MIISKKVIANCANNWSKATYSRAWFSLVSLTVVCQPLRILDGCWRTSRNRRLADNGKKILEINSCDDLANKFINISNIRRQYIMVHIGLSSLGAAGLFALEKTADSREWEKTTYIVYSCLSAIITLFKMGNDPGALAHWIVAPIEYFNRNNLCDISQDVRTRIEDVLAATICAINLDNKGGAHLNRRDNDTSASNAEVNTTLSDNPLWCCSPLGIMVARRAQVLCVIAGLIVRGYFVSDVLLRLFDQKNSESDDGQSDKWVDKDSFKITLNIFFGLVELSKFNLNKMRMLVEFKKYYSKRTNVSGANSDSIGNDLFSLYQFSNLPS